ncbi:MAG: PAC2 family protein [Methanomassiliicoccaceae archaeon]|nr:PAC2 family protein [Methanomassiliicoccaceae archaeon]
MAFEIYEYKGKKWNNAAAVIGFPSIGLASSIAANFLARTLELDVIGGISSPEFPPYAVVQNGIPLPPVRMYAGDRKCDVGGGLNCDGLIVVTSEFLPKIEQHHQLSITFLDWFRKNNVNTVICLEGIPQFEPDEQKILGVGSTDAARDMMEKYSIEKLEDSLVRGTSGVMLYEGTMRNMNVLSILAPARADMPDPRGAAKLMEPLSKMLPELKIDLEPLYKEAEEAERRMGIQQSPLGNNRNKDFLYG